jgi:2,4-dienoyl-CoA reductase-like NADH-dependent reductase (Old Yellow Enzyme family)
LSPDTFPAFPAFPATGDADMIAFGRPFISNPERVQRFAARAELNPEAVVEHWYTLQFHK